MCFNHSTFDVWRQTYTTRHDCSSRMISWWRFPAWKDYYLVSSCRGTAEDRYAIKSGSSALCNKKRQSGSADFQGDGRRPNGLFEEWIDLKSKLGKNHTWFEKTVVNDELISEAAIAKCLVEKIWGSRKCASDTLLSSPYIRIVKQIVTLSGVLRAVLINPNGFVLSWNFGGSERII